MQSDRGFGIVLLVGIALAFETMALGPKGLACCISATPFRRRWMSRQVVGDNCLIWALTENLTELLHALLYGYTPIGRRRVSSGLLESRPLCNASGSGKL